MQEISQTTGESMASLYDRISKGTISVDEITASMQRSTSAGGKYFQSMEKQSKTLNGQISTLKDNFSMFAGVLAEDTTNAISSEFLPAINDTIQAMQEAFSEEGFSGLATAFAGGFTNILMMLVEKAPEVVNVAMTMIQSFVNSIQENLPMIINSAIQIVSTLAQGILDMLPQILQMGITLLLELVNGITEALPELIPIMVKVIMDMVNILLDNIDLIIEAGIQILIALIDGIINALPELVVRLPEIIIKIVSTLINLLPEIIAVGIRIIGSLITGLFRALPELIIRLPELILRMINGLLEGLKDFANVGVNLVKGLWEGISGSFTWIKNKIKGWIGNVTDFIKKMFGIHSPSTVMRDEVGKYVAEGIGVGFEDELDSVYSDMQKAIDFETEKMSANVQTGNVYNNIMNTTPLQVNGTYTSRLEVNGEVLAEVVNDVNDKKDLQYAF